MDYDTKQRIIKGAEVMFSREGAARVTMEDIADYLKISKKTIYNHFHSKSSLVFHVVSNMIKEIINSLEEIASDPDLDFTTRLKAILEYSFQQVSRRGGLIMDNYVGMPFDEADSPVEMMRKKILELADRLFREGRGNGVIRDDVDSDFIPYFYLNVIDGCIRIYRDEDISIRKEEMFREALRIIFEGILTDGGRRHLQNGPSNGAGNEIPWSPEQQ